jgi:hypothetical protein
MPRRCGQCGSNDWFEFTVSAEALLERMLASIDGMRAERDKLKKQLAGPTKGKVLGGRNWHV